MSLHRLIAAAVPNSTKLVVMGHGIVAQDILGQSTMLWPRDPLTSARLPIGVLQQLMKTPRWHFLATAKRAHKVALATTTKADTSIGDVE